jgi:voltage-gated potassium channel Kch
MLIALAQLSHHSCTSLGVLLLWLDYLDRLGIDQLFVRVEVGNGYDLFGLGIVPDQLMHALLAIAGGQVVVLAATPTTT